MCHHHRWPTFFWSRLRKVVNRNMVGCQWSVLYTAVHTATHASHACTPLSTCQVVLVGWGLQQAGQTVQCSHCQSAWCCVHRLHFSLRCFLSQMRVMASRVGSACCRSTWRRCPRSFILVGLSDGGQLGSRFWFVQLRMLGKQSS